MKNHNHINFGELLISIDRWAAWILLITILLYFLSGYGMTKGIIDRDLANALHLKVLPLIAITAFVLHTSLAIRMAFMRWRIWNKLTLTGLISVYAIVYSAFIYFELFYQFRNKVYLDNKTTLEQKEYPGETKPITASVEKKFTLEELAKYDGRNGSPAYVAVDGTVYDVTSVFRNGTHYSHLAGQELTEAFYSRHVKSQITKCPIVGILAP